ncbi:hypothetical protein, partial [Streptococcus pneumoniae]|uniref:hypothetical protein n=1 Tax=Streptococcus pneumoniae TaxID=1313 RepID=UPI0012D73CB7
MLTVKIRKNGELGIFLPIAGMENVQVVTVQTDGEIRWASIGSLPVDKAMHFSAAMRLALY